MTAQELSNQVGTFGLIIANGTIYKKEIHGKIVSVAEDKVIVLDNHRHKHEFIVERVISFTPIVENFSATDSTI